MIIPAKIKIRFNVKLHLYSHFHFKEGSGLPPACMDLTDFLLKATITIVFICILMKIIITD